MVKMVKYDEDVYVPEECCTMTNPQTSGGTSIPDDVCMPCEGGAAVFEIVELLECKYDYECPFDDLYDVNKCEDPDRTCENEYTSHVVIEKKFDISMLDKIGITVFLEKEDAENKLKEMEENHGNWRRKHDER